MAARPRCLTVFDDSDSISGCLSSTVTCFRHYPFPSGGSFGCLSFWTRQSRKSARLSQPRHQTLPGSLFDGFTYCMDSNQKEFAASSHYLCCSDTTNLDFCAFSTSIAWSCQGSPGTCPFRSAPAASSWHTGSSAHSSCPPPAIAHRSRTCRISPCDAAFCLF